MGTVLKGAFRISIHALREESDMDGWHKAQAHMISIHALREESDFRRDSGCNPWGTFQSTLSVRRATAAVR